MGRSRWAVLLAGLLSALAFAAPARAAFPGRNGVLAVTPLRGNGILLVRSDGRGQRRICAQASLCGHAGRPMFSPDGRSVLFTAAPGIRLVGTDGICENCQFGIADSPAFLPDGTDISFVSGGILDDDSIDGIRQDVLLVADYGPLSGAVWSASGTLALAAGDRVWVGQRDPLRSIGPGGSPSWSPDGVRIAIVRRGWITVLRTSNALARRLARGTAPAFSPDGRWIAFIGKRNSVEIIASTGGRAHRVGQLKGRAVDWQPRPPNPRPCVAPSGSKVIARSTGAVVTAEDGPTPGNSYASYPDNAAMGCLLSNGRERLLNHFTLNNVDDVTSVTHAAVNGDYAALVTASVDYHYGGDNRTTTVFDLRTGSPAGFGGEASSCASPTTYFPCSGIDQLVLGRDGVSAVHVDGGPTSTTSDEMGVSCASASLCLTHDMFGQISSSTDPANGSWTSAPLTNLTALSCPSTSLCVGVNDTTIYTSSDPTGGSGAWTKTQTPFGTASQPGSYLDNVACRSTNLCVVTNANGNVLVSTDPTGGAGAWSIADVDGANPLYGIACPTASECFATDGKGNLVSTTNPTGGAGAWTVRQISGQGLYKIACPSTSLCVVIAGLRQLLVSTDPLNGQWTTTVTAHAFFQDVSCPSTSLCAAAGDQRTIFTSTDPASGTWSTQDLGGVGAVYGVSCPTTTFCAAPFPGDGHLLISTNPAGGAGSWTPVLADRIDCAAEPSACGTEQIIASDRTGVHVLDKSTEFEVQTGPLLTGLALAGDTLSWSDHGSPMGAQLTP